MSTEPISSAVQEKECMGDLIPSHMRYSLRTRDDDQNVMKQSDFGMWIPTVTVYKALRKEREALAAAQAQIATLTQQLAEAADKECDAHDFCLDSDEATRRRGVLRDKIATLESKLAEANAAGQDALERGREARELYDAERSKVAALIQSNDEKQAIIESAAKELAELRELCGPAYEFGRLTLPTTTPTEKLRNRGA